MDDWTVKKAMLGDKEAKEKMQYKFELLPCPFCGGTARLSVAYGARVFCGDCGCGTEAKTDPAFWTDEDYNAIETVIKAWNTRPQLLTKEQIEAMERMEDDGKIV